MSLNAAADPTDKTYANQKKAGAILEAVYKVAPNHPGVIHYIIHTYDYPELAVLALPLQKDTLTLLLLLLLMHCTCHRIFLPGWALG